ncbi:uncharacterized protein LOC127804657 [Diospyros lotus]|uniref:uncharacterized protein LOC127804657 n=1 Tax=Diospyros lotus TaxID=55363 RepID=UPI0022573753|nr:uncharacterized protein LOC127804657 [Diospyros lotus]
MAMEASYCYYYAIKATHFRPSLPTPKSRFSSKPIETQKLCSGLQRNQRPFLAAVECSKGGAAAAVEMEKKLEEEMGMLGGGLWIDKCKGGGEEKGIVELMECLEREAIMGEDEGKEPTDYNRRAHIFDHSSRVFQNLKESNTNPPHQS